MLDRALKYCTAAAPNNNLALPIAVLHIISSISVGDIIIIVSMMITILKYTLIVIKSYRKKCVQHFHETDAIVANTRERHH